MAFLRLVSEMETSSCPSAHAASLPGGGDPPNSAGPVRGRCESDGSIHACSAALLLLPLRPSLPTAAGSCFMPHYLKIHWWISVHCPLLSADGTPFPVFCRVRRNFDAKGTHFAVKNAANALMTHESLGQENSGVHRCPSLPLPRLGLGLAFQRSASEPSFEVRC